LQRGGRDLIADRERCRRLLRPLCGLAQGSVRLGRIGNAGARAEPEVSQRLELLARRQASRKLHDADVARPAQHVSERSTPDEMLVVNLASVDVQHTIAGVYRITITDLAT